MYICVSGLVFFSVPFVFCVSVVVCLGWCLQVQHLPSPATCEATSEGQFPYYMEVTLEFCLPNLAIKIKSDTIKIHSTRCLISIQTRHHIKIEISKENKRKKKDHLHHVKSHAHREVKQNIKQTQEKPHWVEKQGYNGGTMVLILNVLYDLSF